MHCIVHLSILHSKNYHMFLGSLAFYTDWGSACIYEQHARKLW